MNNVFEANKKKANNTNVAKFLDGMDNLKDIIKDIDIDIKDRVEHYKKVAVPTNSEAIGLVIRDISFYLKALGYKENFTVGDIRPIVEKELK